MGNKKMYFSGEGCVPIKRGDTRFKGDPIDTDELDPKTVKRFIKKGWLVDAPPGTMESPSIAEYRTRLAKLEVENSKLIGTVDKLVKKHETAMADNKELQESLGTGEDYNDRLKKSLVGLENENSELKEANADLVNANKELSESVVTSTDVEPGAGGKLGAGPKVNPQAAPVHKGAGMYELQDGTKIKGKKEAYEAAGLEIPAE